MSLQSSFLSLSMGRKLRLVLMAVAGVALAVYASLTLIHGLREVEQLNRESLTALLDVTARNLEAPLVFNDGRSAQETLRALTADPGVVEVRVLDREGKLFARYVRGSQEGRSSDLGMDAWLPQAWNRLTLGREVSFHNAPVGRVELVATRERYWAAVARGGLIWAGVTCLALLAASLLARRLQRVLTEPLERLEQAARDIAKRKRFSVRVERGPEDEIGHLIDSFNAMLAEIEHRDQRLNQQRENLEAEVLVRTEELVASRDAAEEATRVKSRFLATMSHEIRTPLNGLLGMMRLLQASPLSPEQARMSEAALRSGETLMHLLNDILDFSKIEAGRLSLDAVPFDLADTVESAVQLLAGNAREKRLELAVTLADNLPATLAGDPNRLKQVLFNLLGNAIKFTDQGEVLLSVTKVPPAPGAAGSYGESVAWLRFAVRDSGVGIPVADQGKLFHAFNQTDMVGSRRTSGTGLGLSISRELVRLMGGDLTVNSQAGEGAEFVFELPLHVVRDNPTAILYPGHSLLLLEPHDTVARIVSTYARFLGMACRRVSSLDEAAPMLAQGGFDLVLADVCYLPQDDAAWEHWQAVSGVPWAALTAFGEAVLPPAFAARLVKPVSRKEFTRLMGQMLRQRSASAFRPASRQIGRPPARPRFNGSVLLVEDNLTNQEVTQGLLQLLGCRVRVAGNGEEALACLEGEDFDLILMDCQMPVMDGLTASRELRRREQEQHRSPTAIIALTANSFAEDRQRCLAAGMNGFLPKPFNESDLVKLLQDWLGAPQEGSVGAAGIGGAPATPSTAALPGVAPLLDESVLKGIVERQGQPRAEFLGRFIATFLASATTEVDALVSGTPDAAAAAHSLKSAAANVGAGQLADLARVLEAAAREGNWDSAKAREAAQRLPDVFVATRAALEQSLVRDAEGPGLELP